MISPFHNIDQERFGGIVLKSCLTLRKGFDFGYKDIIDLSLDFIELGQLSLNISENSAYIGLFDKKEVYLVGAHVFQEKCVLFIGMTRYDVFIEGGKFHVKSR